MQEHDPRLSTPETLRPLHEQENHRESEGERLQDARLLALKTRQQSAEGHAGLSASIHEMFGNRVMAAALAGHHASAPGVTGPGEIIQGAMSLGAGGVVIADGIDGLLSNSMVQGWMGSTGDGLSSAGAAGAGAETAGSGAAMALAAKRGAAGDPDDGVWGERAVRQVNTAVSRGGAALPAAVAQRMGSALGGVDFSSVRIHTDAAAIEAAQAIHAHAFTVGTHIHFNRGAYNPDSSEGAELLAHELTHVRQHMEGRLPSAGSEGDLDVSSPFDAHEVEAVNAASTAMGLLSEAGPLASAEEGFSAELSTDLSTGSGVGVSETAAAGALSAGPLSRAEKENEDDETGFAEDEFVDYAQDRLRVNVRQAKELYESVVADDRLLRNLQDRLDSLVKNDERLKNKSEKIDFLLITLSNLINNSASAQDTVNGMQGLYNALSTLTHLDGFAGLTSVYELFTDGLRRCDELVAVLVTALGTGLNPVTTDSGPASRHARGAISRSASAPRPGDSGRPLPAAVADRFAPMLGGAVGQVRLHTDGAAAQYTEALRADAVAHSGHIYFNQGRFDTTSAEGLALLAEELHHAVIGGGGPGISQPGDAHERQADRFATGAAELLTGQADPAAAIDRLAGGLPSPGIVSRLQDTFGTTEADVDTRAQARVAKTDALVGRLTSGLGLSSDAVTVRTDDAAAAEARSQHTRGLMTGDGEIAIDAARYNPETTSGRGLIAHEVAHVAQEGLSAAETTETITDPGGLAELEAQTFAETFASGGGISDLSVGLPGGHVAAEGDITGADLQTLLTQYRTLNEERAGGLNTPERTDLAEGNANGTENHGKKVDQYEDGVDGIADVIGDLTSFDQLCDAVSDGEDTASPRAQIRASEPFRQLSEMWQGALDGGQDSGQMQRIFNNEFNNRGFWGSTEEAFDIVEADAKASAQRRAEAAEAERLESEAAEGGVQEESQEASQEADQLGSEGGDTTTPELSGLDTQLQALMGQSVAVEAPAIPAFDQLSQVTDGDFSRVLFERNHQIGLANSVASGEVGASRGEQIWGQFRDNFFGAFVQNGADQFIDTMVLDTLGNLGDKGLTAISKGAFRAPFVGPLIGLIKDKPWSAESWTGQGGILTKMGDGGQSLGHSWDNFGTALMGGEGLSGTDRVGIFFAAIADLFGGLHDILSSLQSIVGILSAVAYVAGGILLAVGLALIWLAGIGAPLITAGGWLIRAGGILGRIVTALGAVVLALSALTAGFRAAAAILVPAEMYAQQLQGVGDAAGDFGTAAGNKVADTAASGIKDSVNNHMETRRARAGGADEGGQPAGEAQGQQVREANEATNNAAEAESRRLGDIADETRRTQAPESDDATQQRNDIEPSLARRIGGSVLSALPNSILQANNAIRDLGPALRELGHLRNGHQAAGEALQPMRSAQMADVQRRQRQAKDAVDGITRDVARLNRDLTGLDPTSPDAALIRATLTDAQTNLTDAQASLAQATARTASTESFIDQTRGRNDFEGNNPLTRMLGRVESANADGQRAVRGDVERNEANSNEARRRQLREEESASKQTLRDLSTEEATTQRNLSDADAQLREAETQAERQRAAQEDAQRSLDQENAHLQGIALARDNASKADNLSDQQRALRDESRQLRNQIENAETALTHRSRAEQLDGEVSTAQDTARQRRTQLEARVGKSLRVTIDGAVVQRTVRAIHDDGIEITNGHGRKNKRGQYTAGPTMRIPFDQIANQKVRRAADAFSEQNRLATEGSAELTRLRAEASRLSPDGTEPSALRQQADAKQSEADALTSQIQVAREQSTYTHSGAVDLATHQRFASMYTRNRDNARDQASTHTSTVERLRAQTQQHQSRLTEIATERTRLKDIPRQRRQAEGMHHLQSHISDDHMLTASSGNATGGVGSAYRDLSALSGRQEVTLDPAAQSESISESITSALTNIGLGLGFLKPAAAQPNTGGEQPNPTPGTYGERLREWSGLASDRQEDVVAIGQRQAMLERLMSLSLTTDLDELHTERQAAMDAADRYNDAHEWAYQCYIAEQSVGQLAGETLQMAESGQPMRAFAQGMSAPLQQSVAQEDARAASLAGGQTEVPGSDPEGGSMITGLILKLAQYADRFDDQPNGGDANTAGALTTAQDTASSEATAQTATANTASQEQRQVLDQAIMVRAAQEQSVSQNIDSLNAKHTEELAIQTEIQQHKAQALADRATARAEVESHAGVFNSGFAEATSWASDYRTRREALTGETGS